jgi:hypothetical protein
MSNEINIHPCEPSLDELKTIRSTIYSQPSTDLNLKKCKALESQIERHVAHKEAQKASEAEAVAEADTEGTD